MGRGLQGTPWLSLYPKGSLSEPWKPAAAAGLQFIAMPSPRGNPNSGLRPGRGSWDLGVQQQAKALGSWAPVSLSQVTADKSIYESEMQLKIWVGSVFFRGDFWAQLCSAQGFTHICMWDWSSAPLEEEICGLLPLDVHPSPSKILCHREVGKKEARR